MGGMTGFVKRVVCLAAVAGFLVAAGAEAQIKYVVSAGTEAGLFTVKKGSSAISGGTDVPLDTVMSVIRKNANEDDVEINFNPANGGVDIGTSTILVDKQYEDVPSWGDVKLTGSVRKSSDKGTYAMRLFSHSVSPLSVAISGKISAVAGGVLVGQYVELEMVACTLTTTRGFAVLGTTRYGYPVKIVGGKYSSTQGRALEVSAGIDIEGGEFESGDSECGFELRGNISIVGGTFKSTSSGLNIRAYEKFSIIGGDFAAGSGSVLQTSGSGTIEGGIFNGSIGVAALTVTSGDVIVSGGAGLFSTSDTYAAIQLNGGSVTLDSVEIRNNKNTGRAVSITSASSKLTLVGRRSSNVKGAIMSRFVGAIRVNSVFRPDPSGYTLELTGGACAEGTAAVVGGAAYLTSFKYDNKYYKLDTSGVDIVVRLQDGIEAPMYAVTGDTAIGYVAYRNNIGGSVVGRGKDINDVLDSIRVAADWRPCTIDFGTGTSALDVGRKYKIEFTSATPGIEWGAVTLTGEMSSAANNVAALQVHGGVSVFSKLFNSCDDRYAWGVDVSIGSNFFHSGGNLCGQIYNDGGTVKITKGSVPSINSTKNGSLEITGGTIGSETLNGYAINDQGGEVLIQGRNAKIISANTNINEGTVVSRGELHISDGEIISKNGYAVVIADGTRAYISKDAKITTANKKGAVYIGANGYLYLYGGTVSSAAAVNGDSTAVAIVANEGANWSDAGKLVMYGSPTVNGIISLLAGDECPIELMVGGKYFFDPPENEIYRVAMPVFNYGVVVKNGAGFFHSFALVTADTSMKLAVNGNDIVSTDSRRYKVTFDLNGSTNDAKPKAIPVIQWGTIGELAKPPCSTYVKFNTVGDTTYMIENDGEWHIHKGTSDIGTLVDNNAFAFGVGNNGKMIDDDITLTLLWNGKKTVFKVSVLESTRDLPVARNTETAAVAPAAATSGTLTAGPNPVSVSVGAVSFYRSGAVLKSGKLFIYDASGNIVAKAVINDPSGSTNRRSVAKWNLQDAKGRQPSEGTYVARGVITTKAGKTERVSILINVQR